MSKITKIEEGPEAPFSLTLEVNGKKVRGQVVAERADCYVFKSELGDEFLVSPSELKKNRRGWFFSLRP